MNLRPLVAWTAAVSTALALTLVATPADAASPDLVISEVYGGGGNSGATLTNDFVELYNAGTAAVDVTGWSVQYASASGTSWQVTALSGSVAPGAHYLVAENAGAGGTVPLPVPDAAGSIAMSASSGKVALATISTALTCASACDAATGVRDFVGYGSANDYETAAAPGLSNTTADARSAAGTDTDNNAADFTAGDPTPTNSNGDTAGSGGGGTPPPTSARIHDIQGASHRSPLVGQTVTSVPGVVTAVSHNGFWMQDPAPDNDPATSEGIFVFTSSAPAVNAGDSVLISGKVSEYRPGGHANSLSNTEIGSPHVTVVSSGNPLPAPVVLHDVPQSPHADNPGDIEAAPFDPAVNALDYYESVEGMLVTVDDAEVVGPTNKYGEIPVIVPQGSDAVRSVRGGVVYASYADPNTERLILDSTAGAAAAGERGRGHPRPDDRRARLRVRRLLPARAGQSHGHAAAASSPR